MDRKVYGIFVAGGSGTRMGAATPKQFLELAGKPVLQRTIARFMNAVPGLKVIVVLPRQHFSTWKDLCTEYEFNISQTLVAGGLTRFHSVQNALKKVPDGAVVMIHDGVRPLISEDCIKALLGKMDDARAVIPVVKVVDTIRSIDEALPSPDRSKLVAVQTPQIFRSEDIKAAYSQAYDTAFTDDASVAERKGIEITLAEGERLNIKLTTPEDLALAEAILGRGL